MTKEEKLETKETADRLLNDFVKSEAIMVTEKANFNCPPCDLDFWREVLSLLKKNDTKIKQKKGN